MRSGLKDGRGYLTAGRRVAAFGLLLAVALVLRAVESLIPVPLPFVRLGLANVATLLALVYLGIADAVLLAFLRVLVASVIAGTFLGPAFGLAMAGGLTAAEAMGVAFRRGVPPLGLVGVSLVGAAAHNIAQLAVLALAYTGFQAAIRLLPAALLLAAASGLVTGLVAHFVVTRLASARVWEPAGY